MTVCVKAASSGTLNEAALVMVGVVYALYGYRRSVIRHGGALADSVSDSR